MNRKYKSYPTIKIVQRKYTLPDGTRNVFLRLTINRKSWYFPLNVYVNPRNFNPGIENTVSRKDLDHEDKNILIDDCYHTAREILLNYRKQNKLLTLDRFENDFYNGSSSSDSFYN